MNKTYFKSVSILALGSVISVVFLLIQHLLRPYIFTAEELGIYSVILTVPQAFVGLICARYDICLVYEEDDGNIPGLLKLNIIINAVFSTVVTLITLLYFLVLNREVLKYWYLLFAVWIYLFAYGMTLILNSYNNRMQEYGMISKMHVFRVAAQSMGTVILGLIFVFFLKWSVLSVAILVVPYCVGMAVGIRSQGKGLISQRKAIFAVDRATVGKIAKKHIKQPLLSAPAIFANNFSYSLITMLMDGMFGKASTGHYSLSITLLGLPISLIAGNMSKVYMRDASREYVETGTFKKAFWKNCMILTAIAIPMFFAMFFLAPPLCVWMFGAKWQIAGTYIKALALMFSFRFVSTALSPGLSVCRKQMAELIIQLCLVTVTALAGLLAFLLKWDSLAFLWAVGGARAAVMMAHIITVGYFSNKRKDSTELCQS